MEKLVYIEKCSQYNNQEMEQKIYKSIDSVLPAKENLRDKKNPGKGKSFNEK